MKFKLICLFAAMLFVLSACSSERTKENKNASESQSEIASEATDVSAEKDEYYEYNIVGDSNTVMLADEIPEETDFILMTSLISVGKPAMTISTDNDKKLFIDTSTYQLKICPVR